MTTLDLGATTAFVTGSTRGIGLAIARALYAAGAKVAIVGRDAERARAVAGELGDRAAGVGCDVAVGDQVEAAVASAEAALGPITLLVNNAGVTRDNILLRLTDDDWDQVLDANLKGAFHTTIPNSSTVEAWYQRLEREFEAGRAMPFTVRDAAGTADGARRRADDRGPDREVAARREIGRSQKTVW